MSDEELIGRIDSFCDAVPRQRARAETIGPLTLFVPVGAGYPYYARPRGGDRRAISVADVRAVRARQRELLIPESFEWIEQTAPDMAAAADGAGLRVHPHPLLVLDRLTAPPVLPPRVTAGILGPEDPDVVLAWSVPAVAFGHPGTGTGEASVTERDKIAANYDPATVEMLRVRLRAGQSVLPASRRRGLGAAVTHVLAAEALRRGASTVFLSASDAVVARIYARLGFREIGTAMIAEPPED